jgi:BTB/POZ domain
MHLCIDLNWILAYNPSLQLNNKDDLMQPELTITLSDLQNIKGVTISNSSQVSLDKLNETIEAINQFLRSNPHLLADPQTVDTLNEIIKNFSDLKANIVPLQKAIEEAPRVTIRIGNTEFPLYRYLLTAKMEYYFKSMSEVGAKEESKNYLVMDEETPELQQALRQFLSQEKIILTYENVANMLLLSNKYILTKFKEEIEQWILDHNNCTWSLETDHKNPLSQLALKLKHLFKKDSNNHNIIHDPLSKHELFQIAVQFDLPKIKNFILKPFVKEFIDKPSPESKACHVLEVHGHHVSEFKFEILKIDEKHHYSPDNSFKEVLKFLPKLETCTVICYEMTDQGVVEIAKLKDLKTLKLYACRNLTEDAFGKIIKNCPKLTHLEVSGYARLSISFCQKLVKGLTGLKELLIHGEESFTDECVKELTALKNLSILELSYCQNLTDASIEYISKSLHNLTSLRLVECVGLTDTSMKYISEGLKNNLTTLILNECKGITHESIPYMTQLENLTCLELIHIQLTLSSAEEIGRKLKKLTRFVLNNNGLKGISIIPSIKEFKNLRELFLNIAEWNHDLMDEIAKELPNLIVLSFFGGMNTGFKLRDHDLKYLQTLDLSINTALTDECAMEIAKLKNLTSLNLYSCYRLTEKSIKFLIKELTKLESLDLTGCYLLNDKAIKEILEMSKHIKHFKKPYNIY